MTFIFLSVLPLLAFAASLILLGLAAFQSFSPAFQFWPPPADQLWKKSVFMILFRTLVYGVVASSFFYLWHNGLAVISARTVIAVLLLIVGFCIAFASTLALGWANAFGSRQGLRTSGIFNYSRNPIYLATWFGLAGWALIISVPLICAALLCWAMLYVFAIFSEEKWLAQEYGQAYLDYCQKVRRFV